MADENAQKFIIHGRLSGRNEAEAAARSHWSAGAKLKKVNTETVMWEAVSQRIKPVHGAAAIEAIFYEGSLKRDIDNVMAGVKYLLDGLVAAGIITNDTRKNISELTMAVKLDSNNPRIEVTIKAADNESG